MQVFFFFLFFGQIECHKSQDKTRLIVFNLHMINWEQKIKWGVNQSFGKKNTEPQIASDGHLASLVLDKSTVTMQPFVM